MSRRRQFRRYFRRIHRQAHGPADRALVIASNANDILPRALASGSYAVGEVRPTQSPRWTFRSLPISSGCCSRPMARRRCYSRQNGRALQSARSVSTPRRSPPSAPTSTPSASARRRRAPRSPGSGARRIISPIAYGGRHGRGAAGNGAARDADAAGRSRHRASRQISDAIEAATGLRPPLPPHLAGLDEGPSISRFCPMIRARSSASSATRSSVRRPPHDRARHHFAVRTSRRHRRHAHLETARSASGSAPARAMSAPANMASRIFWSIWPSRHAAAQRARHRRGDRAAGGDLNAATSTEHTAITPTPSRRRAAGDRHPRRHRDGEHLRQ